MRSVATLAPNLTDPNVKFALAEFLKSSRRIPDKGMQAWDKLLDDKQITQLYTTSGPGRKRCYRRVGQTKWTERRPLGPA